METNWERIKQCLETGSLVCLDPKGLFLMGDLQVGPLPYVLDDKRPSSQCSSLVILRGQGQLGQLIQVRHNYVSLIPHLKQYLCFPRCV